MIQSAPILDDSSSPNSHETTIRVFPSEWKQVIRLDEFSKISKTRDINLEYRILRVLTENAKMVSRLYRLGGKDQDRYKDILPFVENRVILPGNGYINASYMPNHDGTNTKAFIACQGPLSSTVGDMWSMIWMEEVEVVFAIGSLYEGPTEKFVQYWPNND